MWDLIKKVLLFRVGQRTTKQVARIVGLSRLSMLLGVVGGIAYMRRHSS